MSDCWRARLLLGATLLAFAAAADKPVAADKPAPLALVRVARVRAYAFDEKTGTFAVDLLANVRDGAIVVAPATSQNKPLGPLLVIAELAGEGGPDPVRVYLAATDGKKMVSSSSFSTQRDPNLARQFVPFYVGGSRCEKLTLTLRLWNGGWSKENVTRTLSFSCGG